MKKNLIVVRAGDKSLHSNWLKNENPEFDIIVTYYGNNVPEEWKAAGYPIYNIKGGKWTGLYQYFTEHDEWKQYDKILLPDDDLDFDARTINGFFYNIGVLNADLSQPCLHESSYYNHLITLRHPCFNCRVTNFIELMIPCFSRRLLEKVIPTFAEYHRLPIERKAEA